MEVCTALIYMYLTNLTVPFGTVFFCPISFLFPFFLPFGQDIPVAWTHNAKVPHKPQLHVACGMPKTGTWEVRGCGSGLMATRTRFGLILGLPREMHAAVLKQAVCASAAAPLGARISYRQMLTGAQSAESHDLLTAFAHFRQLEWLSHFCGLAGVVAMALVIVDLPAGIHSGGNLPAYKPPL